jgi:hypothetical protein
MEEAAKYEELAALLKAERDNQLNKISAGAAERGPGLAGPTGAVGVYNQDRFVRPTVDPLIEGLVVKAKQAALQEQLKQLADAAGSRYQRAASAYAAKQAAAASGDSPLTSPGENSIVEKTAPTIAPPSSTGVPTIPLVYTNDYIKRTQDELANRGVPLTQVGSNGQLANTPTNFNSRINLGPFDARLYQ